jgi:hypothetical protein
MPEATARAPRAEKRRPSPPARRTVLITGRPDGPPPRRPESIVRAAPRAELLPSRPGALAERLPRMVEVQRRRPSRPPRERLGPRPDRIAMWALLMAVALVLVTAMSAHAAV